MARIVRPRIAAADALTASVVEDVYEDFETATTAGIGTGNVRSEGLDVTSFALASTGESGLVLVDCRAQGNGGATSNYAATVSQTKVEVAHGSGTRITYGVGGQTIVAGDILRLHWQVLATAFEYTIAAAPYDLACWLVWLEWDITSNALANWTAVPGQSNFVSAYADTANTVGGLVSETRATLVIPHGLEFLNTAKIGNDDISHPGFTGRRSYVYQHTGDAITVYGIRMVINGLYFPWYTSSVPANRIVHEQTSSRDQESVTIGAAQLLAILMRGD